MKELKKLQRRVHWSECIHLALLTLCLAVPIALIYTEDDQLFRLRWALGTVIPVQLVRYICQRVEKKKLRPPLCAVVVALTMLLTRNDHHWVYYLVTLIPVLIFGLIVPWHRGKMILTLVSIPSVFAALPPYLIGKALSIELISSLSVVLAALLTLNFFVHVNLTRLFQDIRFSRKTEISLAGIVRNNRRVIIVYALIGALLIAAVPLLLQKEQTPIPRQLVELEEEPETVPATEPPSRDYRPSKNVEKHDSMFVFDSFATVLAVVGILGLGVLIFLSVKYLLDHIDRRGKLPIPELEDGLQVERLEKSGEYRQKEKLSGWEKKIRRRYEKLILARTPGSKRLNSLTPAELEAVAGISRQPENAELHEIYEQARYSAEPPTREDYHRFKTLSKTLEHVAAERNLPK